MAQELVADGAVPGLAIAVVHDDEVVYLERLRPARGRQAGDRRRRHGVPDRLALQAGVLDRRGGAGQRGARVLGQPDRRPRTRPSRCTTPIRPPGDACATCSRTAAGCPAPPATTSRRSATTATTILQRLRLVPPSSSFRAGYSYSNVGLTAGGARGGEADRQGLGEGRRGEALPAARHGLDQLAPHRLPGARQPRRAARQARRRLGGAGQARSRRAGAGRRRQLDGARSRRMDAPGARQRQLCRQAADRRRRARRDACAADGARRRIP